MTRHLLTEQPRDPLHTHLHYVGQAREASRGGEPATHAVHCPAADYPLHVGRCAIEPRMVQGVLVRPSGVKVSIATREMRAGR